MEDPEAYLRALAAPLAWLEEGSPLPITRFSLEAVANAFVVLGLLPAERAEEILAAQRPVLEAAGFRVGLPIGELSVKPDARAFQEARGGGEANDLRSTPLAVAAGPVRCRLRSHDLVITSATLTQEGIWLRYHGDALESGRREVNARVGQFDEEITELSITDDTGATYLMPPGGVQSGAHGRTWLRSASGELVWIPQGEFLVVPASGEAFSGGRPSFRWLEFSAGSGQGTGPVRLEIRPPAVVPTGAAQPPWPTPAECYLAELAPVYEWSIGSFETGSMELDAPEIVAAVAAALLAVGALPPGSALLTAAQYRERRPARADWQTSVTSMWLDNASVRRAGQANGAGLAARLPLEQATAVIENITAYEDLVSIKLYGHPWVSGESWPMILPCFRVTAVDDTGVEHEAMPDSGSFSPAHDGTSSFWFWPPVPTQAKQLRVTVSTLWEAAWADIDIPGR